MLLLMSLTLTLTLTLISLSVFSLSSVFSFHHSLSNNTVSARNKTFIEVTEKKSSNEREEEDANKCNSKSCRFSHSFSSSIKNTSISDDKRLVPTGPNPLHNR
ncbi:hypothetical protein K1719_016417 [Acacia pycnantha]|nr:hypothetical protein K1719_016417 [Acacia pycnantha]